MICEMCGKEMFWAGREIVPGRPDAWTDGYVCPDQNCSGYGFLDRLGVSTQFPSATIGESPVHRMVLGAVHFKKRLFHCQSH